MTKTGSVDKFRLLVDCCIGEERDDGSKLAALVIQAENQLPVSKAITGQLCKVKLLKQES